MGAQGLRAAEEGCSQGWGAQHSALSAATFPAKRPLAWLQIPPQGTQVLGSDAVWPQGAAVRLSLPDVGEQAGRENLLPILSSRQDGVSAGATTIPGTPVLQLMMS